MSPLRRIVLLRHGDTVGNSRERFHGSGDVALSDEGRDQVRAAGRRLATEVFDLVASSPLRRAWQSAALLCGGSPVLLVPTSLKSCVLLRASALTLPRAQRLRSLS